MMKAASLLALAAATNAQMTINRVPIGGGGARRAATPGAGALTLQIQGVGNLTVRGDEDPATSVERFAAKATEAGHRFNLDTMTQMLSWLCERRRCGRPLTGPVLLNVTGAGELTVMSFEEPAAKVEEFARKAVAAGIPFNVETMEAMLNSLCQQRSCFRGIAKPLTLNVTEVGEFTVMPWEEPADRVEYFCGLVVEAGVAMNQPTANQMLSWFCERRSCSRPLARPLTLSLKDVGNLTVRGFEEPAFMVERFAAQATAAGVGIRAGNQLHGAFKIHCAQRGSSVFLHTLSEFWQNLRPALIQPEARAGLDQIFMLQPRRRRDSSPRNIHVAPAASPRLVSKEYPRGARGVAATRLRGISTWHPRRRRDSSHRSG